MIHLLEATLDISLFHIARYGVSGYRLPLVTKWSKYERSCSKYAMRRSLISFDDISNAVGVQRTLTVYS